MPQALFTWWSALCTAAALNICALGFTAWRLHRRRAVTPAGEHALRVRLLWLAAFYVLGCAFRSVFPMLDVARTCLHATWISRISIGRSVATVAELAFAMQLALLLRSAGATAGAQVAAAASRLIVPCVSLAELCCWTAVLKGNYLLHAFENSLWTLTAVFATAAFVDLWYHAVGRGRRFFGVAAACAAGYVAYMVRFDVPMYVARWQSNRATHHPYLPWHVGLVEILGRCTVLRDWSAWREDVPWLTLYFTLAAWMSIGLVYAPLAGAQSPRRRD